MKKILILILMCLIVTGCSFNKEEKVNESVIEKISAQEVKEIVDNYSFYPNVDIIDVREADEFALGHIEGAINIPLLNVDEIHIDVERELIVYCQSGRRSEEAAKILKELGYEKVSNMGGLNDWPYELVEEE